MTIQFKEGNQYKIQHDYYEHLKLECSFVEDNHVWFVIANRSSVVFNVSPDYCYYKLNRKTNKLYRLNGLFSSWDTIENTLSEYVANDTWSKRHEAVCSYNGIDEDLI